MSLVAEQLDKIMIMLSGFGSKRMEDIGFLTFLFVMGISLVVSFFISYLYLKFYENRSTGSQIHRAFPLLGVSITSIFICIQFSLPLSLGLLGALSIVRFRTPIKEPEEIGFIMLIVASSIACATFNMAFLAILMTIALAGLLALKTGPRFLQTRRDSGLVILNLSNQSYQKNSSRIEDLLEQKLMGIEINNLSQQGSNSTITYSFRAVKDKNLIELQTKLAELIQDSKVNILLNRPEPF